MVPIAIRRRLYELELRTLEILAMVLSANMRIDTHHEDHWYIENRAPLLHAKRTLALMLFYFSFPGSLPLLISTKNPLYYHTVVQLSSTTQTSGKYPDK